jgi:mono/diheme cytochrome c family protein
LRKNTAWIVIAGLALVVVIGVVIFGGGDNASTSGEPDARIAVQDPDLVAIGEPLYQGNCASCHGSDLRGTDLGPSHLSVVYEPNHHGDGAFILAARNGVRQHHWPYGDMAPVPGLDDSDLEAIIAYVRENQREFGFESYPP